MVSAQLNTMHRGNSANSRRRVQLNRVAPLANSSHPLVGARTTSMAGARVNPASIGGYDEEFVKAVEDDLQCAICQLPMRDPILTKCGHKFCRQCIVEHFKRYSILLYARHVVIYSILTVCLCEG